MKATATSVCCLSVIWGLPRPNTEDNLQDLGYLKTRILNFLEKSLDFLKKLWYIIMVVLNHTSLGEVVEMV